MPWEIAVAGTVHLDDITTPHGRRERLCGGSAVYFSLAAAPHARVHLHGIVGRDSADEFREILAGLPVDLTGLEVSPHPTFHWHAVHDFDRWVAVEVAAEAGCDPEWEPSLGEDAARAQVLFLGSMRPQMQRTLLAQSQARLVGCDSMTIFIGAERDAVLQVVRGSDILFLNRTELAALVPDCGDDWRGAAAALVAQSGRLRAVVVKAGPLGAALVTARGVVEHPAAPVARVTDPTGAGDALAGGFLGACAAASRDDDAFLDQALDEGLRCAAAAIAQFGTAGLRSPQVSAAPLTGDRDVRAQTS